MKVSIVSAYNAKVELTGEFLNTMLHTTAWYRSELGDIEMILVNGGNPHGIEHPFITRRIDLPENKGFCHTLNHGLRAATGDYIFFVGNDSFPQHGSWLYELLKLHTATQAWMTCPANDNPGMDFRRDCYLAEHEDHWEASWFPSIAWLMHREQFERVGLLDEGYVRTGMFADNDYCDRIRCLGGKIVVSKNILLKHLCSAEGQLLGTHGRDMAENSKYFQQRCEQRRQGI
jgi:GT2 family glycosyltransferase